MDLCSRLYFFLYLSLSLSLSLLPIDMALSVFLFITPFPLDIGAGGSDVWGTAMQPGRVQPQLSDERTLSEKVY